MNAYELAKELKIHISMGHSYLFLKEIETMLSKQADRIAELEGEVSELKHMNKNWQLSETMAYNRIAELENQNPYKPYIATKIEPTIVSYTTPQTKPLSNEEIADCIRIVPLYPHPGDLHRLARAIEERIFGK